MSPHHPDADVGKPGWSRAVRSQGVRSTGRVLTALIAWPPLGLGAALLYGEVSGCARFSVACTDATTPWPWVIQLITIALFLLLPAVARIAAFGTYAMLIVVTPLTLFLVTGGRAGSDLAPRLLVGGLALAWIVGVAVAAARRRGTGNEPLDRGSAGGPQAAEGPGAAGASRAEGAPPVP